MPRSYAVAILAAGALVTVAPAAGAATQTGRTSEGVRFTLDGRVVSLRVPAHTPRGATLRVACGSQSSLRRDFATAARRVRPRQRLRLRLRGPLGPVEWCTFAVNARNVDLQTLPSGAAVMHPRPSLPPAPLQPGPGVREAVTTDEDEVQGNALEGRDGEARFLLSGSTLTVRLSGVSIDRSTTVALVCGAGNSARNSRVRIVAVGRGRRVITADIGPERSRRSEWCLLESGVFGAGDIVGAAFGD